MKDHNFGKDAGRKIIIETPQGEVEITGAHHQHPGICPYCDKPIPLSSIIFRQESNDGTEIISGSKMAERQGITIGQNSTEDGDTTQNKIGECPYCHKPIPLREIVFKNRNRNSI